MCMWTTFLLKSLGAIFFIFAIANVVDWLTSGSRWAHKYFAATPDIWRPLSEGPGRAQSRVVAGAIGLTALFAVAFVLFFLVMQPGVAVFRSPLTRALAVGIMLWLMLPVPFTLTQHLFIKYHRANTAAHLAGWLVKLIAASAVMTYLL